MTHLERSPFGFNISISDLAVVNNHGVTGSATRGSICPANTLGEFGIRIRQKELHSISTHAVVGSTGRE